MSHERKSPRRRPRRRFLALIAVAILAAAIWRVAADGLSFGPLLPYIDAELDAAIPEFATEIGSLDLRWGGFRRGVDLVARDVRLTATDTEFRVPEIRLTLSLRALLRGRVAPSQVEIVGVSGELIRERDGTIRLVARGEQRPREVGEPALERLLGELSSAPDPQRPLSYMRSFRLRDATITLRDHRLGVVWAARKIDVNLYSAIDMAVGGEFRATVLLDDHETNLDGTLAFDAPDHVFQVRTLFAGIPADIVGNRIPALREVLILRSALSGNIDVDVTLAGHLQRLELDITGAPGDFVLPGVLDDRNPFHLLRLQGQYDSRERRWQIAPALLHLGSDEGGGPKLALHLEAGFDSQATTVAGNLELQQLAVDEIARYWPSELRPGTRKWIVERVDRGDIEELEASARVHLPHGDSEPPKLDELTGRFRFRDLRVRWHDHAPAIDGIDGEATYADYAMRFALDGGRVKDMRIASARVDLVDLEKPRGRIEIGIAGAGPLADVLDAIDFRPPPFVGAPDSNQDLGTAFASFRGDIDFTMSDKVRYQDLRLAVDADLRDVPIDSDLARGTASGVLRLDAVRGESTITADVDLLGLRSELRILGWRRDPSEPGRARFTLTMIKGDPLALPSIDVDAAGLRLAGEATFDEASPGLRTLRLSRVESGRTSVRRAHIEWLDDEIRVDIGDGSVDLLPLFGAPDAVGPDERGRALTVTAAGLDALWLSDSGGLENVAGEIERTTDGWQRVRIDARVPAPSAGATAAAMRLELSPSAPKTLSGSLTSGDFGGLVRVLGRGEGIRGGTLRIDVPELTSQLDAGRLNLAASDFAVADTPFAVRLLGLASLDSMLTALQGGDLQFDELDGALLLEAERLRIDEIRANGSSLGWVARGTVDLESQAVDVDGTLIPAYTANRFLHSVPVLREVIVGEGILAVDFSIDGTLANPTIDAHPLTAITPELLRGVFGGRSRPSASPRRSLGSTLAPNREGR